MEQEKRPVMTEQGARLPQRGPMEGMVIVNGRPQLEGADMPVISFESIAALMRWNETKTEEGQK